MAPDNELLIIQCDAVTADELCAALEKAGDEDYSASERHSLDGDVTSWLLIASLAVKALPDMKEILLAALRYGRIREMRIKTPEYEIKVADARREDIDAFLRAMAKYLKLKED